MSGWISIHRKIKDHWLWEDKPFSRGQAWIDILMMVNHEDRKILLGKELIEVKRGSRVTSIRQLCDRWGWSNTKVKSFLELLSKDNMLVIKSDTKKTTLTVLNYNDYQISKDIENDKETSGKHQENDTETSPKHTNNNDNNYNNDNNDNKKDIYILSKDEESFLNILSEIENYPLDRKKDLEMYHTLEERYPTLNLLEAIDQWRIYKLDQPLKVKSNPRSQINTAFKKYVEWGKCLKGVNSDGEYNKPNNRNIQEDERIKPDYSHIGFKGTGKIDESDVF
ncbi:MAG: hypothetical protein GX053_12710 [Tissierella sp.]|nr:hypothetical protein [Tissierella sp.]